MTDFTEDPFYLPKDTKVFIICNPQDLHQMGDKRRVEQEFRSYGYDNISIQYYVTKDQINDSINQLGLDLNIKTSDVGIEGIFEWYTFATILRKARILDQHVMIAFSSSHLPRDIYRSVLKRDATYHNKNIVILNAAACNDILDKVQDFDINRTMLQKRVTQIIRAYPHTNR
jgi:hypothetical protein